MPLYKSRMTYKPFEYPWAFELYDIHEQIHWHPKEVSLARDVKDWNHKLTSGEKSLLTNLFRFFTQGDIDIAGEYLDDYIPMFQPPEVRMMLSSFAAREAIHIQAYSLLIDTVGMPESEYKAFMEYDEMRAKHEYLNNTLESWPRFPIERIAVFSAFGEGLQLFSSFAILLNFQRFNKMKGMCEIVTWSIRDESLHVEGMIKLFHTLLDENPQWWTDEVKGRIYQACRDMVDLEDKFIDLCFKDAVIEGLNPAEVKEYIRYIADRRLLQLGLKPNYGVSKNPLEWLDWILNGVEHTNFFEGRVTEYAKGALTGSWDDVWKEVDKNDR